MRYAIVAIDRENQTFVDIVGITTTEAEAKDKIMEIVGKRDVLAAKWSEACDVHGWDKLGREGVPKEWQSGAAAFWDKAYMGDGDFSPGHQDPTGIGSTCFQITTIKEGNYW